MLAYICLGVFILFITIKALSYRSSVKRAPSQEQLSKLVLSILKSGQRDHE